MSEPFKIGLAGLGTVGVGVVKILQNHADVIEQRAGRKIEIVAVSARSAGKDRGVDLSAYKWVDNFVDMAANDDLDAVIEMIGGSEGDVRNLVESSIQNAKHVVTANKALLAHHGASLAASASKNNVSLGYEAAIAGGIPIVKAMREGLAGNDVEGVYGILNGTCNYILTEMRETGRDFDDVLKEAQEKGYAEADPTFDVDGIDAAHKLTLLTALGFGVKPDFDALPITGIRDISSDDIRFAGELGYKIKLLGITKKVGDKILQRIEPCLVSHDSALGNVEGVFNAVCVQGDFVNKIMLEGPGAGEGPTASAVVSDIVDIARGNRPPVFGVPTYQLKEATWADREDIESRFYLHLEVQDTSGVIA
ncbi:MAG: homoserine dehydrogenase, partial [Alphaproteobacteria bacterium]|nr:homoserine dehydrogenase [Alphaproteobacteria bacterium]